MSVPNLLSILPSEWFETYLKHKDSTAQKATIHQVTMLATSENVLFPGYNHLLTTGSDDPTLGLSHERQRIISTGG